MSEAIIYPGMDERSLENPNIPLGDPRVWHEIFGDFSTDTGERVNAKGALSLAPVYQAVSLISGDVAKIPLNVYRRRKDLGERGREVDEAHPAQFILRHQANSQMTAFKFWRRMMTHALLWGNAYALIERTLDGRIAELLPLLPDRTIPTLTRSGETIYQTEIDGDLKILGGSQVLHIESIAISGTADCEWIAAARNAIAQALAVNKFSSRFFKNGARVGGILEVPVGMSKQAVDTLETGFRKSYEGTDNSFKTVLLRDGAKFHNAQFTPEQSQMLPVRREMVREIARFFNLPPHKLGDDSRVSYNSLEQENRSYLDSCLSVWLHTIASECWLKLLSESQQKTNTHLVEHNTGAFIAADIKTQYEVGVLGVTNGLVSPNEVRAYLGLNPRPDGEGDKYIKPMNMETVGDQEEPAEPAEPAEPENDNSELEQKARRLVVNELQRAANQVIGQVKTKARKQQPSRFCTWVDDNLEADLRDTFTARIADSVALFAEITDDDSQQLNTRLTSLFFDSLKLQVNDVLQSVQPEELRDAVDGVLENYKLETQSLFTGAM